MGIPYVSAADIHRLLSPRQAAAAIADALRAGVEPSRDPARGVVPLRRGEFLLMPSQSGSSAGVKVATVAPGNPARGLPRIQAVYVLFDAETLAPVAILDGTALTALRTPAVPAAMLAAIAGRFTAPVRLVVFGAGPIGLAVVRAVGAVDGLRLAGVTVVTRRPERVRLPPEAPVRLLAAHDPAVEQAVRSAGILVCATTAREPVVHARDVPAGATVIAVGSHEPGARELDGPLLARGTVIVEDTATALREAGDVVLAIAEGHLSATDLVPLAEVIRADRTIAPGDTVILKTTGMAWQDLAVAEAVHRRWLAHGVNL